MESRNVELSGNYPLNREESEKSFYGIQIEHASLSTSDENCSAEIGDHGGRMLRNMRS